jgi:long-chain acyl-CoA synthetase
MLRSIRDRTDGGVGRGGADGEPERRVAALYAEVLGVPAPDPGESFFALGGTSLLVVQLLERVEEELGVHVPLDGFYDAPTLGDLCAAVLPLPATARPAMPRGTADLAALLRDAAGEDPQRAAVIADDGTASYAELLDLVEETAGDPGRVAGPPVLRLATSLEGARDVLARMASRRPTLLLDPGATAAEERAATAAFDAWLATAPDDGRGAWAVTTSGSTGRAKVVVSTYDAALAVQQVQARVYGLGPGNGYLVTAPLHYNYGLKTGLLVGLLSGATVLLASPPLTPQGLRACAARHPVAMTMGVSFAYRLLLAARPPLASLRRALVGGDPLPADVREAWEAHTRAPLMTSYGSSETDHVSVDTDGVPGSVGRPLPRVEVRVLRDDGSTARAGTGELLVRSPGLALGYAGDPDLTRERFRDGWFHSGDLAEVRDDGHVLLRGRLDDQVNLGGTKVDPVEVEQACREALPVTDCAVAGVPGAGGMVELRAWVVADRPVTRADVVRALAGRLSTHKVPTRVERVDALPRLPTGKVDRVAAGSRVTQASTSEARRAAGRSSCSASQ